MIENIQKHITIPSEHHGQRIDSVLAILLPEYSRSQISSWIKSGAVTKNHAPCKAKDKVLDNDFIALDVNVAKESADFTQCTPENISLEIVYEDEEVLVINKPAGLVVHPGAGNREHTLVNALLHYAPELQHVPRAGIIHRLDKDTTGLLIIAKSLTAHTSLIRQMQAREIERKYITLVYGHIISSGIIDTFFGRHPRNRIKMAVTKQGRQAITHFSVNKHYQDYTLLDVCLMTGRTHQIRVHLAHIKHPVVGDQLYGSSITFPKQADASLKNLIQNFKRQALHAHSIKFHHPKTNKEIACQANIPDDFTALLHALDAHYEG